MIRVGFSRRWDIFMSTSQPWDQMDPAMPKFEEYSAVAKNRDTEFTNRHELIGIDSTVLDS